jgi:hypothetical protein
MPSGLLGGDELPGGEPRCRRDGLLELPVDGALGPVEVVADGVPVRLGGSVESTVMASVAIGGAPVPERLIDEVWGDSPPVTARKTLQT